jgi:hypothetical protein
MSLGSLPRMGKRTEPVVLHPEWVKGLSPALYPEWVKGLSLWFSTPKG